MKYWPFLLQLVSNTSTVVLPLQEQLLCYDSETNKRFVVSLFSLYIINLSILKCIQFSYLILLRSRFFIQSFTFMLGFYFFSFLVWRANNGQKYFFKIDDDLNLMKYRSYLFDKMFHRRVSFVICY